MSCGGLLERKRVGRCPDPAHGRIGEPLPATPDLSTARLARRTRKAGPEEARALEGPARGRTLTRRLGRGRAQPCALSAARVTTVPETGSPTSMQTVAEAVRFVRLGEAGGAEESQELRGRESRPAVRLQVAGSRHRARLLECPLRLFDWPPTHQLVGAALRYRQLSTPGRTHRRPDELLPRKAGPLTTLLRAASPRRVTTTTTGLRGCLSAARSRLGAGVWLLAGLRARPA